MANEPAGTAGRGNLVRDVVIMAAITAAIFVVLEAAVRTLAPQTLETVLVRDEPLGLPDDVLGHVNRPNAHIRVKGPEYEADYQVSAQGFRDAAHYSAYPEAGVTRILLVGDSFAFGVGNQYEEAWPTLLESSLREAGRRVEIIKAGVAAYDTNREILYIERLVELYHPHKVLINFLPNDLFTNKPLSEGAASSVKERDDVAVQSRNDKKSSLQSLTLIKRMLMRSDELYIKLYLMTPRAAYFTMPATDTMNQQMDVTRSLLAAAHQFCLSRGIDLAVVSIPQQFQVLAIANNADPSVVDGNYIDREFTKFGDERNLPWFPLLAPLTEAYVKTQADAYYRFDGHLNPLGNRIVAAALLGYLQTWLD